MKWRKPSRPNTRNTRPSRMRAAVAVWRAIRVGRALERFDGTVAAAGVMAMVVMALSWLGLVHATTERRADRHGPRFFFHAVKPRTCAEAAQPAARRADTRAHATSDQAARARAARRALSTGARSSLP